MLSMGTEAAYARVRGQEGFTLVELMIVILIIGILVGIAVPVYIAQRDNAQRRVCQANLRMLKDAAGDYLAVHQEYPYSVEDLVPEHFDSEPICPNIGTEDSYAVVSGGGEAPPRFSCNYHGTDP